MTTVVNGLLGGLLAGLVAGGVTVAAVPTALSRRRVLLAGVGYGGAAGALLVALELFVLGVLAVPPTVVEAMVVAGGWSALLLAVVTVGVRARSAVEAGQPPVRALVVYHLVYGLVLGGWIRLTWIT